MNSHFSPPSPIMADIQAYHHHDTNTNEEPTTPLPMSGPPPMISSSPLPPPIVYGELSILGYNGLIPNGERSGRRNKSKYLLCKRPQSNGIKKSRHYIVKQPQATRAIQDKGLHSISYTFSRTQTIIVEYRQDETTDMFQIGRSSEEPIDFVVMDTLPANCNNLYDNSSGGGGNSHGRHHSSKHHPSTTANSAANPAAASSSSSSNYPHHYPNHQMSHNENLSNSHQQQMMRGDLMGMARFHRHLAKAGEEMAQYGFPLPNVTNEPRSHRLQIHGQPPVLLNYPPPNISNLQTISNQFRYQDPSLFHNQLSSHVSSNISQQQQNQLYLAAQAASNHSSAAIHPQSNQREHSSSRHNPNSRHSNGDNMLCKRSHTTQSTISRFACRVLVDREPPYTARIYAAGFDSSKNIFLGEKATKWEQDNVIDGLTTNGVLLMHPKRGYFQESADKPAANERKSHEDDPDAMDIEGSDNKKDCSNNSGSKSNSSGDPLCDISVKSTSRDQNDTNNSETNLIPSFNTNKSSTNNDSNNNNNSNKINITAHTFRTSGSDFEYGGVWREVSVDGGIYAIRESRSATQKGRRIDNETNILQDGTLIDLCGATLLWRSLEGFKASPTKRSLEEKIDMLNASRPQCPVGLNTLVIPRKPILPNNNHRSHNHHHHHRKSSSYVYSKDGLADDNSGHQPYVYLKCGHVQGYHDWGTTEKSNQRTCPICLSVGHVAKLSMGLEPSFYVDSGPLTYVFNPCGHMASERTVKYWCSINIPHGTHFFHAICPFCATPLTTNEPPSTRIIFQEDSD